jgi:hypothetical protein
VPRDGLDQEAARAAELDGPLHALDRVLCQQLQHADILPRSRAAAVLPFEVGTQLGEHGRQFPVPVDVGVIERRRLPLQRHQIVQRVEHLLALGVRAHVPGNDLAAGYDRDLSDVALDRHRLERERPRHAVVVRVEADGLVLVHRGRLGHARVESPLGQ